MRDVRVLWARELTAALRERNIVFGSLLVPAVLYPGLLWAMYTGFAFVQGRSETQPSRVVLAGLPPAHAGLALRLRETGGVEVQEAAGGDLTADVQAGRVDLVAEFEPADPPPDGNLRVRVLHDRSRDRGEVARRRFEDALADHRDEWIRRELARAGLGEADWRVFRILPRDVATGREMGAFLLGLLLPLLAVSSVAIGAFYPAIDATAGERERSTFETTLTLGVSRGSVVVAKYLFVVTMGAGAGLVNLASMLLSMGAILRPLLGEEADRIDFALPPARLLVAALALLLTAFFVAAAALVLASFARTFKEGQAMLTPLLLALLVPLQFALGPGVHLTPRLALLPPVSLLLLLREGVQGTVTALGVGLVVLGAAAAIALSLLLAARLVRREEFLLGTSARWLLPAFARRRSRA